MSNLKIISWNVNGLRAIQKKGFHQFVQTEKPDILAIQETKAHDNQLSFDLKNIDIKGKNYDAYFSSAQRKGYSGVALYTLIKPKSISFILADRFDDEARLIRADYDDFILFNVYFPNGKRSPERLQYKMDFYQEFLSQIKKLLQKNQKIVVLGDVNTAHQAIDLARPKENEDISGFLPKERAWMDQFLKVGFIDSFRHFHFEPHQYTWWSQRTRARSRNIGWRIDYIFVSQNLKKQLKDARILSQVMGSDHCPIEVIITN